MYRQRIMKEANEASKMKDPSMFLIFEEKNLFNWTAFLQGPEDSPFKEGIFEIKMTLSTDYPLNPPKVIFKTKIFHPNVHWETGEICLDIIKTEWAPSWTLESLCRAILYLMSNPNADSPLNCDSGNLIRNGFKEGHYNMARMYTIEYAICKTEFKKLLQQQQLQNQQQQLQNDQQQIQQKKEK